jgi:hypothetical protein
LYYEGVLGMTGRVHKKRLVKILLFVFTIIFIFWLMQELRTERYPHKGHLYTKKDIIFNHQISRWYGEMSSSVVIIENEEQLKIARNGYLDKIENRSGSIRERYINISEFPEIDELINNYPINDYTYVIQYLSTGSGSRKVISKGVWVDEKTHSISFDLTIKTNTRLYTADENGHIFYAAFPKGEISDCIFDDVSYPDISIKDTKKDETE